MDSSSNQTSFCTLTADYVAVKLASGLTANTATLLCTGATHASVITDVLFRNVDSTNTRNFDFFIGPTTTAENNLVQVAIPASSGNTGTVPIASLAALAPAIFDIDLAGNRIITLESGTSIYVVNKAALTADMFVRVKRRSF